MKNTKNIIAMIMALITVASLFTSCDKQSNGQPSDSSTGIITTSETIAENVPTSGDESTRSPETTSEPETTEPETTEPETTEPAETYPEDPNGSKGLTFQKCEGGYKLVSMGRCTDKDVIVPKTHKGKLVVEIASAAFIGAKIESVFIPETVKRIGDRVFSGCRYLTTVTFSEGLEEIGEYIFENTPVENVVFPKSVLIFSPSSLCRSLAVHMVLEGSNVKHITLGGAIENFGDMLNNLEVESITFHEGYKVIASNAFSECYNLKRIYLPTTIERVEWVKPTISTAPDYTIYVNPKSEPNVVFYTHSGNLTSDVKVLASHCFDYNNLKSIDLHEGIISICRSAFYSCRNLESVSIPSTVKYLGNTAFAYCENLKSITLPDGLEYVGSAAFRDCKCLLSITLPDGIDYVGPGVFNDCTSLQYNEYDNALYIGTKSNPYYMLVKAKSKDIESVEIHPDTKQIDQLAFEGCTKLTSVTVPEGVRKIYSKAFYECTSLKYLYLPDTLENTPNELIGKCNQLERIRLPEGFNTEELFLMTSLKKIIIEGSIKEISRETFRGPFRGHKIAEVTLPDSLEIIGYAAFESNNAIISLVLPDKVTTINARAFADSTLENITLPKSVNYIGYHAFLYTRMGRLTITYPGTKEEFKAIKFDKEWCTTLIRVDIVCSDGTLSASEKNKLGSNAN